MTERFDKEDVSLRLIRALIRVSPDTVVIGDVVAGEIIVLAAPHLTVCPSCGSKPFLNVRCDLCTVLGHAMLVAHPESGVSAPQDRCES